MNSHPHPTRRRMLALTGAALVLAGRAQAEAPAVLRGARPTRSASGAAFGSHWHVTLPDADDPQSLRDPVQTLLDGIDRLLSPWRPDSEIGAFNRAAPGRRAVSPETAHVATAALRLARASEGWFDPSVGPLVARWGFGPIEGEATGWRDLDADPASLGKTRAGLTFDPCGIAKGRALDLMAARLADQGHGDFLIDLGGELAARGRHPSGRDWQVAVEDPRADATGAAAVLALRGRAVATSGLRAQSYDLGGHRYGHIIDPRSRTPMDGPVASVSVLAGNAMIADGWATALSAAGLGGPDLARRNGIDALFLIREGEALRQVTTGGFAAHLL